ncbi:MAG: hypothetical protein ACRC6S_01070 [Shewanella sp.]
MKTTTIAMFVGLLFSLSALANTSEQAFFNDTYQSHDDLMDARLQSLRSLAAKELRDINIEAKLSGNNKWLILGQFDRLRPNHSDTGRLSRPLKTA